MLVSYANSYWGAMCSLSRLSCLGFISDFTLCQQGFIDFLVMSIESANSASASVPPGHVKRLGKLLPNQSAKLKDQFHEVARFKYLSGRTEGTYWQCHVAAPEDGRTPSESCFHAKAHFQTGS